MTTTKDLEAFLELAEKATPGPIRRGTDKVQWNSVSREYFVRILHDKETHPLYDREPCFMVLHPRDHYHRPYTGQDHEYDMELEVNLFVAARNLLPEVVSELIAARRVIEAITDTYNGKDYYGTTWKLRLKEYEKLTKETK